MQKNVNRHKKSKENWDKYHSRKGKHEKKLFYDFFMLLYLDYIGFFATKFTSQTGENV